MSADGTSTRSLVRLALADLLESPWQPAGRSERDLVELVASMSALGADGRPRGIIEPLIVRRLGAGYRIVAGGRRRAAGLRVGIEQADCIVRDLSDEEERALFYVSNAQRTDLSPLEEADYFDNLRACGWSPDQIADQTGKGRATVYRRLLLRSLVPDAREALASGRLLLGVAERLATINDAAAQAEALSELLRGSSREDWEPATVVQAQRAIDDQRRRLDTAPFPIDDTTLVTAAGACIACPKRSSAQLVLLGEGLPKSDRCTDRACFTLKSDTYWDRQKADAEKRGVRVLEGEAAKKLYPYGSQYVHSRDVIDLDASYPQGPMPEPSEDGRQPEPRLTWRQALGSSAPPTTVVRLDSGEVRELADKRAAERALGLVDEAAEERAGREYERATRELEVEHRTKQRAEDEALVAIVGAAEITDSGGGFWRMFAGLLIRAFADDGALVGAAKRRAVAFDEDNFEDDGLMEWIKNASIAKVRALAVELAIGLDFGERDEDDQSLPVACRFYGIDLAAIQTASTKAVRAELRAKAKGKKASSPSSAPRPLATSPETTEVLRELPPAQSPSGEVGPAAVLWVKTGTSHAAHIYRENGVAFCGAKLPHHMDALASDKRCGSCSRMEGAAAREANLRERAAAGPDPLSEVCPRCKAAVGSACSKRGGGHHVERTRIARDSAALRHSEAPTTALDAAAPSENFNAPNVMYTRVSPTRFEVERRTDAQVDEADFRAYLARVYGGTWTVTDRRPGGREGTLGGLMTVTVLDQGGEQTSQAGSCRICGCTPDARCVAAFGERCEIEEGIGACSVCLEVAQAIEERLEHRPRLEDELLTEVLDASDGPAIDTARVTRVLGQLILEGRVVTLDGGRVALQRRLAEALPLTRETLYQHLAEAGAEGRSGTDLDARWPRKPTEPDTLLQLLQELKRENRIAEASGGRFVVTNPLGLNPGDRVLVVTGSWAGRAGVVDRLCQPPFGDRLYVRLDIKGKERREKVEQIGFADVQRELPPAA